MGIRSARWRRLREMGNYMRKKNGFTGRRLSGLSVLLLMLAATFILTGCVNKTAEELKKEYIGECKEYVEKWLEENDPGAIWPGYSTVKIYEAQKSNYTETRVVNAASGLYRRKDGEEVSFVYDVEARKLYVSSLPKKYVDEIAERFTLADGTTLTGIRAGKEAYLPVIYTVPPGKRTDPETFSIVGESEFAGKLIPAKLTFGDFDESVPQVTFSDMDNYTVEEDRDAFFRQEEIKQYLESKWCSQIIVEISLTDSDFLSRERDLIEWVQDYQLCGAIVRDGNGESWTIIRSNVLSASDESGTKKDTAWLEHFTVSRGEDPGQAADAADVQYFVRDRQKYSRARKITVQLNEQGRCEVRFDEPGESWDKESVPTEY